LLFFVSIALVGGKRCHRKARSEDDAALAATETSLCAFWLIRGPYGAAFALRALVLELIVRRKSALASKGPAAAVKKIAPRCRGSLEASDRDNEACLYTLGRAALLLAC
jgi:hypothetical protein